MEIEQTAIAGTLESSYIQITVSKSTAGINIELDSQVAKQYGTQIKKVLMDTLNSYGITSVKVKAVDKGALDCTIKARIIAALNRSLGKQNTDIDWEVL